MHVPHMLSIKCGPVMLRASSVLVTSKVAIRREKVFYIAVSGMRSSQTMASDRFNSTLLSQVISLMCQPMSSVGSLRCAYHCDVER
jgi:hypothetical protein